jgi:DNA processing protein
MLLFVMGGTYGIPFNIVEKCYAVVGTRKPTLYGESVAMSLGKRLSNLGITVVSGLAMGVDKRAHEGSLKGIANVPTIAVLGSGLLQIYPRINSNLAGDIVGKGGLIVSEFGLGQSPRAHFFPRRNRIISALSSSVVIVEAEEKSGSLITARLALEQNRDVYAVPGPIDSMLSRGTNKLIAQGASIIISVEDFGNEVIEREGFTQNKKLPLTSMIEIKYDLSDKEKEILNVVSSEALSFEEIMNITRLNYSELRLCITNLQLKDIISERDGIYFREEIG